jgi:hypothetical protein
MIEVGYYCAAILFVCTFVSYVNKKFGFTVSSLVSLMSFLLCFLFTYLAASGEMFFTFLLLFPGVAWVGFLLGGIIRKRQISKDLG